MGRNDTFDIAKFSADVKRLMQHRRLSQKDLAELVGVSKSTICRLLKSTKMIDAATFVALLSWMGRRSCVGRWITDDDTEAK